MKQLLIALLFLWALLSLAGNADASCRAASAQSAITAGQSVDDPCSTNGARWTEQSYTRTKGTADVQIKGSAGFVHGIMCAPNDAAPTAGQIVLFDNTAESGTEMFRFEVTTTYFLPFWIPINAPAATGIYLGYTTTNDVNCWVSFR